MFISKLHTSFAIASNVNSNVLRYRPWRHRILHIVPGDIKNTSRWNWPSWSIFLFQATRAICNEQELGRRKEKRITNWKKRFHPPKKRKGKDKSISQMSNEKPYFLSFLINHMKAKDQQTFCFFFVFFVEGVFFYFLFFVFFRD